MYCSTHPRGWRIYIFLVLFFLFEKIYSRRFGVLEHWLILWRRCNGLISVSQHFTVHDWQLSKIVVENSGIFSRTLWRAGNVKGRHNLTIFLDNFSTNFRRNSTRKIVRWFEELMNLNHLTIFITEFHQKLVEKFFKKIQLSLSHSSLLGQYFTLP